MRSATALDLDAATHGVDGACELGEHTVAHGLGDTPAVLLDLGTQYRREDGLHRRERSLFVVAHEPTVTRDVSRENRREPPLARSRSTARSPIGCSVADCLSVNLGKFAGSL
ncbi:MAG TPA: hypothetical protein VN930_03285 [Xanthobacteraceae bacterium]|nr:hypothetical protein [Xanthobacteraceae bacterium]